MKLYIGIAIYIFFISINGFSQINPIDDVKHVKPESGLIKREVFTTEPDEDVPYLSEAKYYNEDGYEIRAVQFNSKGDTTKNSFIYYLGNGLELSVDYEKGKIDSAYEQYNEMNLLMNDVYLLGPEDPSFKDSTIYCYDETGNLEKIDEVYWKYKEVYKYKDNKIVLITTTDADVEEGEKPEVYVSDTYKYLEGGRKIENKSWIGKGKLFSKTYYSLNENHLPVLIEVYEYSDKGADELSYKRVSTYYENGNLKYETIDKYEHDRLKWASTFTYNEKGLFTTQIYSDGAGKKRILEYKYYYK